MKKARIGAFKRKANIKKVNEATESSYEESHIALLNEENDDNTTTRGEFKEEVAQRIIINVKMPGRVISPNRALDMIGGVS